MQSEKCGIYQIRCLLTGKCYIGSSKRIYTRWSEHRYYLRKGTSVCVRLQNAWAKYGEGAFEFSVLEECCQDELEDREQFYIDTLDPQYNSITDIQRRYGAEMLAKRAAALRARAALITHCPRGHAYDEANTYINKKGKRICRACNALRVAAIFAAETPDEREARRVYAKASHEKNKPERLTKQREYTATHKEEKRAYDAARREITTARKRERLAMETPEQREIRRRQRRESYYRKRNKEQNL